VNDLSAIIDAVTLLAKGNKGNQAILNRDIPSATMGYIAVQET
jgi:hypothetical protein